MKPIFLFVNSLFLLNINSTAQKSIIRNTTIIPTHINQSYENKDVVIENGKIFSIREHLPTDTSHYDKIVDGKGKFVIPGMVDAHAHFPKKDMIETYFLMNLVNGVTTLRSMRGEEWHLELDRKGKLTPNLILSSVPIRRTDSIAISELNAQVKVYKDSGYDFIKILSIESAAHFDALVSACKVHDIGVAGHCSNPIDYERGLKSGVYESIEHLHGYAWLREYEKMISTLDLSISNNVAITPTTDWYYYSPETLEVLKKRAGLEFISSELKQQWESDIAAELDTMNEEQIKKYAELRKRNYEARNSLTALAYKQGANLLVGPDLEGYYGVPGFGYVEELKHFVKSGISNHDALKAATYNMAIARGSEIIEGTIKIGAEANLVILNQNPLNNIENVTTTDFVVLRGNIFSKADLMEVLKGLPLYE